MLMTPASFEAFPWMRFANAEYHQTEVAGVTDNERILQYLGTVGLGDHHDETPWCAAFVNWCLLQAGLRGSGRANARSFLDSWDAMSLAQPSYGCVVVLSRPPNPRHGHVAFYTGRIGGEVLLLGGNQSNRVKISEYADGRVLAYALPRGMHQSTSCDIGSTGPEYRSAHRYSRRDRLGSEPPVPERRFRSSVRGSRWLTGN